MLSHVAPPRFINEQSVMVNIGTGTHYVFHGIMEAKLLSSLVAVIISCSAAQDIIYCYKTCMCFTCILVFIGLLSEAVLITRWHVTPPPICIHTSALLISHFIL